MRAPALPCYRTSRSAYLRFHAEMGAPLPPQPTIEHVVPRAVLRRPAAGSPPLVDPADMHNFVVYTARVNSSRGCRRMADERDLAGCLRNGAREERRRPFVPEEGDIRGRLARCVGYVMLRRPDAADAMRSEVLCQRTLLLWTALHPPSDFELALEARVAEAQRDDGNDMVRTAAPGALTLLARRCGACALCGLGDPLGS